MTPLHGNGAGNGPAMIPGEFEGRPRLSPVESGVPQGPLGPHASPADSDDLERLEREREGGGAPPGLPRGSSVGDRLQRALLGLTERFIRLMSTGPIKRHV